MTSSPPFLLELSAPATSPLAKAHNNYPFPPGSPLPCSKGFSPVLSLEVPLPSRKEFSDHLPCTTGLSPNAGKRFTITSPCLSQPVPSPAPQAPVSSSPPPQRRCSFEPFSPLLGRLYSQEPAHSSPPSPCFDRFSLQGSPSPGQRNLYCNCIGSSRSQRPCPPSPCFCYCSPATSPPLIHQPLRTSPVTSPQLTHISFETSPVISTPHVPGSQGNYIISPLLTHRPLRPGLIISPPLAHRTVESRPLLSTPISHRVLETGPMISHWSSGRSYNDLPLSSASIPPTGNLYHDHPKPPDSCEPKPELDGSLGKNGCGPPVSSQAGVSCSPILSQQGTFHYSHLCSESQIPPPRSPYSVNLPPERTGSPSSSQPQPCLESFLSWETEGNSYLLLTPCPTEAPLPQYAYPTLYFPSPLGNQFLAPPQSPRSYNEPPLPTPAPHQVKSPRSADSRRTPYRCRSLVNTSHHTPLDYPKSHKTNTSPQPLSQSFGHSCPLMEPSITTTSNSLPKEHPPETAVDPATLKTVAPTSCPQCLPYSPLLPGRSPKSSPHGPPPVSPCNTHMYSVVPPTSYSSPLSSPLNHSTHLPQGHNQPVVPCGTYTAPRGPPPPNSKPVVPPCSTHIYSFIPLRTPFDPRCLPVVPRVRLCPNTIPCGLHTYAVSPPGPPKDPPQIPYSSSLPSPKSSTCSTIASCSSTFIVNACQSSESQSSQNRNQSQNQNKSSISNQNKSPQGRGSHRSRSRSQSRSRSSSPSQSHTQDLGESTHLSISEGHIGKLHLSRSRKGSKSPQGGKSKSQSKSPHHRKSHGRSTSPHNKKK
ncbi:5-methylcytosine rRNA methyltransferase NSUN4 isoform X1 [Peromyscus eremicus]|uniref:5-methylcytosine rRNA methyltransferase NSUN4 isoform X1 n=1 Tax=Peromyscus eremicus TaxID=42410 RepID=UPI0027DABFE9|nr:5-methylcytosine rRNA methyltransferase NSUN4 isoform X1 [Peromyscus eremicus]